MARNLSTLVLDAPTSTVNIEVGQSFTMTISGTFSGSGGINAYNLQFQWDQGIASYEAIPSSGGLYSADTTSYTGTTDDIGVTPKTITVYGGTPGTYNIRGSNAAAINSGVIQVNVTGGTAYIPDSDGVPWESTGGVSTLYLATQPDAGVPPNDWAAAADVEFDSAGATAYEFDTDGVGAEFASTLDFYSSLVFEGDSAALFTAGAALEQHYAVSGNVGAELAAAASITSAQEIITAGDAAVEFSAAADVENTKAFVTDGATAAEFASSTAYTTAPDVQGDAAFNASAGALFTSSLTPPIGIPTHDWAVGGEYSYAAGAGTAYTHDGEAVWLGCEAGLEVIFSVYNDRAVPIHDWGVGDGTYSALINTEYEETGDVAFEGALAAAVAVEHAPVSDAVLVASAAAAVEFAQGISLSGQVVGVFTAATEIASDIYGQEFGDAAVVLSVAADVAFANGFAYDADTSAEFAAGASVSANLAESVTPDAGVAAVFAAGAGIDFIRNIDIRWGEKYWGTFYWKGPSTTNMAAQALATTTFTTQSVPGRGAGQDGALTETDQDGAWTEPPPSGAYTQDDAYTLEIKPRTVTTTEGKPTT